MFFPVHLAVFYLIITTVNTLFNEAFEGSSEVSENEHNFFGVEELNIISIHFIYLFS